MNTDTSNKATIVPNPDGSFKFDNGITTVICKDADIVGAFSEQQIWPLLEAGLKSGKKITITIEYGTD